MSNDVDDWIGTCGQVWQMVADGSGSGSSSESVTAAAGSKLSTVIVLMGTDG